MQFASFVESVTCDVLGKLSYMRRTVFIGEFIFQHGKAGHAVVDLKELERFGTSHTDNQASGHVDLRYLKR